MCESERLARGQGCRGVQQSGAMAAESMGLGLAASGKHGLNILSGIRLDGGFLRIGASYFFDDVLLDQFLLDSPSPQGGETDVIIEEGFLLRWSQEAKKART